MQALPKTPFPVTFRELWLPPSINGVGLPSSVEGGHPLTLTGAKLGSTADGVHFDGSATSNINAGAIHNAAAKLWLSFRFKLDQDFAAGTLSRNVWGKYLPPGNDYMLLVLDIAAGKLLFAKRIGGAWAFLVYSTEISWNAGQWYHVLASISDVNAVRLIIDGGTPVTNADVSAAPNGGDFVLGDRDDPGAGEGFHGVIADFVCGTDDLLVAEEADLYKGIPPADAVNFWPLREGRGVTAYDRGTGGNNGTLDTSCKWKFGQVEQPVLSLDGINDRAVSSSGIDLTLPETIIVVIKTKSTYSGLSGDHAFFNDIVDGSNELLIYYTSGTDKIVFHAEGNNITRTVSHTASHAIDDYLVLILTVDSAGLLAAYVNGSLVGASSGVGTVSGGAAIGNIGATAAPAFYDISKPLFKVNIDGAFTQKQARAFSKWLKDIYNLPIPV